MTPKTPEEVIKRLEELLENVSCEYKPETKEVLCKTELYISGSQIQQILENKLFEELFITAEDDKVVLVGRLEKTEEKKE